MDYTRTRVVNVVLGVVCVGAETFAYNWSFNNALADKIYLGVVSFFTIEALIAIFVFANKPENIWERLWRIVSCMVLMGIGMWLIVSALDVEVYKCVNNRIVVDKTYRCHHYELKLGAGILAVLNGILYLFANPSVGIPEKRKVHLSPDGVPLPNPYASQVHIDGQPVYTMPRAHLQNQPSQQGYHNPGMVYDNNTAPASQYSSAYQFQQAPPVKSQAHSPPPAYGAGAQQAWNYNQPTRRY